MDFTREPIIETVITPRDGFRLAVRNSKNSSHEEHFVDALQVVSFGGQCFYRTLERPKAFILPVSDYEILEVREPKILLKNPTIEGSVKITPSKADKYQEGRQEGRQDSRQDSRYESRTESRSEQRAADLLKQETLRQDVYKSEVQRADTSKPDLTKSDLSRAERAELQRAEAQKAADEAIFEGEPGSKSSHPESGRGDRRRDRRRGVKNRRRGAEQEAGREGQEEGDLNVREATSRESTPRESPSRTSVQREFSAKSIVEPGSEVVEQLITAPSSLPAILPPPNTLIRDDIARLKANELYRGAFYVRDESEHDEDDIEPVTRARSEPDAYDDFRARPESNSESNLVVNHTPDEENQSSPVAPVGAAEEEKGS